MLRTRLSVAVLVLLTAPVAVAASPSPDDRTTSLTVSPQSLTPRATLTLSGFSDCAVIDGHLVFTRYDGTADNVVVRAPQAKRYDAAREKYPYAVRIQVPAQAKPGTARVYAEPFCGPPEEYPPSRDATVRIVPSRLALTVSPRRPRAGDRLRVTAATCNGPGSRLSLRLVMGGQTQEVRASIAADGRARAELVLPDRSGSATLSAPAAGRECPGSTAPSALVLRVRSAPAPASPVTTPASSAASVPPPSSPTSVTVPPPPPSSVDSRTAAQRRTGGVPTGLALLGVGAVLLAGLSVLVARRRAR